MVKDRSDTPDKLVEKTAEEVVKKKRNYTDPYHTNFGAELAEPGDNSRYLRLAMTAWNLPPIDISDPKQVEQRIMDYFNHCAENDRKPNIKGLGNWLGVSDHTVRNWRSGLYRDDTHLPVIERAINVLQEMWWDYMQNGKINPASGIFLGKNAFGMKDVQDVVVTPNNPLGDAEATPQLADKYLDVVEVSD